MYKADCFDEIIGGGTLSENDIRSDLSVPENLVVESELDKQVARLLILHPELQLKFRQNNVAKLDDETKRVLLAHMREFLGIFPLLHE